MSSVVLRDESLMLNNSDYLTFGWLVTNSFEISPNVKENVNFMNRKKCLSKFKEKKLLDIFLSDIDMDLILLKKYVL